MPYLERICIVDLIQIPSFVYILFSDVRDSILRQLFFYRNDAKF